MAAKIKTAKVSAAAWYVDCPECGEGVPNESGSLMWGEGLGGFNNATTECLNGHKVRIPERLRNMPEGK